VQRHARDLAVDRPADPQPGSNRNAIYQTMYAARRKLRAALVASGHLDREAG